MTNNLKSQDAFKRAITQHNAINRYYRFHAKIYDATRWGFLFGRNALIDQITQHTTPTQILEIGCGTGKNLKALAQRFPQATITGLDMSADMLSVARQNLRSRHTRVKLVQQIYADPLRHGAYDLVLFSYALTMMNPGWPTALAAACHDLAPSGTIAVVDFHNSTRAAFKRWMGVNHVRMDGHLLPVLETHFKPQVRQVNAAYAGLWSYFLFLGQKS